MLPPSVFRRIHVSSFLPSVVALAIIVWCSRANPSFVLVHRHRSPMHPNRARMLQRLPSNALRGRCKYRSLIVALHFQNTMSNYYSSTIIIVIEKRLSHNYGFDVNISNARPLSELPAGFQVHNDLLLHFYPPLRCSQTFSPLPDAPQPDIATFCACRRERRERNDRRGRIRRQKHQWSFFATILTTSLAFATAVITATFAHFALGK